MAFRIDRHISTRGTRLQTYLVVPFERLVARFGEPRLADGVNSIYQWVFSDNGGNVYTIYDWKATTMVDRNKVTPAKLRELPEYKWHIGSTPGVQADWFKEWVRDETLAKSPDVNVKRRELLCASFYRYDSDQLGYLEASQMRAFIRKMATKFRRELTEEFIEESLRNFCEIDANGHGKVYQTEFVNYFLTQYEEISQENFLEAVFQCTASSNTADTALRSLFWKLDHDGSGFIPCDTVKTVVAGLAKDCNVEIGEEELAGALAQFTTAAQGDMLSEEQFQTIVFEIFARVEQALFLDAVGHCRLPFAGPRETVLANLFQRHNRETLQADEMHAYVMRLKSRQDGKPPTDDEVAAIVNTFSGVSGSKGLITEEEFVQYFQGETQSMNDTDFFTLIQYLWHGYLNFY